MGINFTTIGSFLATNSNGPQYFDFTTPKTFSYFKIVAKAVWDGL